MLGLAIAELLAERYPQAREGELARRYNRLVRKDACAEVARELNLGAHIIMGGGEAGAGGRKKSTILSDACEALLGAIFKDGGFEPARRLIRALWEARLAADEHVPVDAKTALQEWAQGRKLDLPRYVKVSREGPDHAPIFTVEVRIAGLEAGRGDGPSKQIAEQAAACAVLIREGVWSGAPND